MPGEGSIMEQVLRVQEVAPEPAAGRQREGAH